MFDANVPDHTNVKSRDRRAAPTVPVMSGVSPSRTASSASSSMSVTADRSKRIDDRARVHDPARVKRRLGRLEGGREQRRSLLVVPTPVVAPDGVVVGDRAAVG